MKTIKPSFFLGFFFLFQLLFAGCRQNSNLSGEEFIDLGSEGLISGYQYEFRPFSELNDNSLSQKKCDVSIVVRFSERCQIKSLPLETEYLTAGEENVKSKKIEIELFNDSDTKTGKGNFGIYEVEYPLIEEVVVDDCSFIAISTLVPDNQGVLSIGIKWDFK